MIVVGGDNLIDLIESVRNDGLVSFTGARGGSGYNTACAVARQQQSVGFITPISTDNLGQFLADKMISDGVELLSPRSEKPSSLAVVTLMDGQPSYQFYRNDTAERQVDLPFLQNNFPAKGRAFHLTSLAISDGSDADAWADFFAEKHRVGTVTTLDPNVRSMLIADRATYLKRLWRLMNTTDILKLSDEDLEWIFPNLDFDTACVALLGKTSAKLSIVTKGAKGAICYCNGLKVAVPAYPVPKLVDTVGAGDTFMGTVLSYLNSEKLLSQAVLTGLDYATLTALLTRASKAAAINCGREGCQPPIADALN